MDSNVSTDTRPSAAFKGETLQIARENPCQNHLQAAPSHPPSGIHLRCRDETLEKTLAKRGLRQRLPATTWQASLSRSSNPPMSPKGHSMMLFPPQAASVYPSAKGTVIISQATHPRGDWGSTCMAPRPSASACHPVTRSPSNLQMWRGQGTHESGALEATSSSSGELFFTGVVCEHSFVAKKLPSYCSESKDKATVKITPYFDSSQIVTINDPFSLLSCMLVNVV